MVELSHAGQIVRRLVAALGRDAAHHAVDALARQLSTLELAALAAHWPLWALPKQLPPEGVWRSWTRLSARRGGKSHGASHFIAGEVEAGRARLIGLAAPTLERTIAIQVLGPSGLIATAAPWCRPTWHASTSTVQWPNGARAWALSPEVPQTIRGIEFDHAWLEEIQDWPRLTRDEAWSNFLITTSSGVARTIISATPRQRHSLLREIEARAARDPAKHVLVRGTIHDNPFLGVGVVEDMIAQIGLETIRGRQELLGEMVDDSSGLIREAWIDGARRDTPAAFTRRVIACDPSITSDPRFSDRSGIVDMGVAEGQLYVLRNLTARHRAEELGGVLVDAYIAACADLLVLETNRGGNMPVALLRVAARDRGLEVIVVGPEAKPTGRAGTVYVREVNNRNKKHERLAVGAALLERGKVSFVRGGVGLADLEEQLLAVDGSERARPDDGPDAFAIGAVELSDATRSRVASGVTTIAAATAAQAKLAAAALRGPQPHRSPSALASVLPRLLGGGGRI